MSQKTPLISDIPPAQARTWNETWSLVLTQPSVGTFQEIIEDPKASKRRAYLWVFVATLVGSAISVVVNALFSEITAPTSNTSESTSTFVSTLLALLLGTPVSALLATFVFADAVLLTQFVAHKLGGTGTIKQLMWASAAYVAPLSLGATALSAISIVNCTALLLSLYGLLLNCIAIKTVNRLSWGKAFVAALIAPLLLLIIAVALILLTASLSPRAPG